MVFLSNRTRRTTRSCNRNKRQADLQIDNKKELDVEMNLKAPKSIGVRERLHGMISAVTRVSKSLTRVSGEPTHVADPDVQFDDRIERICAAELVDTAQRTVQSTVQMDNMRYAEALLEWVVHLRVGGERTGEEVEKLARDFENFAGIASISSDALFKGLAGAGISSRSVDLKPGDPDYAEKLSRGIKRPRVRLYSLPASEVSEPSSSRETAPRRHKSLVLLGCLG